MDGRSDAVSLQTRELDELAQLFGHCAVASGAGAVSVGHEPAEEDIDMIARSARGLQAQAQYGNELQAASMYGGPWDRAETHEPER